MSNTYSNLLCHVVFSTKHREAFITPTLQERLYPYMGGLIRAENAVLYQIGGLPDHVHLLVRCRTDAAIADLVRELKSRSSAWVHESFPQMRRFGWQDGYAAFSVSHSEKARVAAYIVNQQKNHQRKDFKTELVRMLIANEIEFDEKYLWD